MNNSIISELSTIGASIGCGLLFNSLFNSYKTKFLENGISGRDVLKRNKPLIPEAQGVLIGCCHLLVLVILIPVHFYSITNYQQPKIQSFQTNDTETIFRENNEMIKRSKFLLYYIAGLLSISCMTLLGFCDDILDLKWKHRLILPSLAALPLLVIHQVSNNSTMVVMPIFLRPYIGLTIDLGILYYIYMGCIVVFCTNSINILAGANGVEVGQSLVITLSIIIFNLIELNGPFSQSHRFSLFFLIPFFILSLFIFYKNFYPAQLFVGDTYCYLAGMQLASVAILGHFSKTLLLFFLPQIFNFLFSFPQLLKIVPCPRHRMPEYDGVRDLVLPSKLIVKENHQFSSLGKLIIYVFRLFHLIDYDVTNEQIQITNFTILNLIIRFHPTKSCSERRLVIELLILQLFSSSIAFIIRYYIASIFYD
ncbi:hypothetical protein SNEBB_009865 [Seison nebaliae]|nr:hypothetical protein SNEBB_009865 [Seison nebaliae]